MTIAGSFHAHRHIPSRSSGPLASALINVSWPKYGISVSLLRSLNSIISFSVCTGAPGPSRARYAFKSALRSVLKNHSFCVSQLTERVRVGRVDDRRSVLFHCVHCFVHQRVDRFVKTEIPPHDANPRSLQAFRIEELSVIIKHFPLTRCSCGIFRVGSRERPEKNRGVPNCACHGTGRVLRVRNRNDSIAADQADRRFDADDTVDG